MGLNSPPALLLIIGPWLILFDLARHSHAHVPNHLTPPHGALPTQSARYHGNHPPPGGSVVSPSHKVRNPRALMATKNDASPRLLNK